MKDVERLLLLAAKNGLAELSKKQVGMYNIMEEEGIYYIFDGKEYLLSVKEVEGRDLRPQGQKGAAE